MTLARAIESARSQDLRALSSQAAATRRLLANIDAIIDRVSLHRAAVDVEFHARRDALAAAGETTAGEASLATYPIGFCGAIRDKVLERLVADPAFRELIGTDTVLKKIFVLLKGVYFQNALQLGNLYLDAANDTVDPAKPPIEWLRIEDTPYQNADDWKTVAEVGRRYYEVELYPNLLFPLAFPLSPFFAIRASGRIDFFHAQDILFLKDLGDDFRRARALLAAPAFLARPLPEAYRALLERSCGGNLRDAFPIEYAPTDAAGIRDHVLAEFSALAKQNDAAALNTLHHYQRLMKEATARLARLNLRPPIEALARLRAEGAVPAEDTPAN